jgi:trehalose-6-phosphate synthase
MAMPLEERLSRWRPMAEEVRESSARSWCRAFLAALEG